MTLRSTLKEFIRDELDLPVHNGRLSARPMMPAAVQSFIATTAAQSHSNPVSLLQRRVQVDVYAQNDEEVDALAKTLVKALDGYHGPMGDVAIGAAFLVNDRDMQPEQIKGGEVRYRRTLDFVVAYQEPRAPAIEES